ncbi:PREDICTED: uncharacterized protein LOC106747625 [Dinoponera quadriceps]|uniref:Uncharacterized protein LOC106747625 n=1 Tax=Dinoponera quadriceps TaxID=609295 RepID=A0A6P3XQL0_DINQU|nr:PREDICTED: uncharacterized protein LOC106747625 [Dinoponera quadriceps]
MEDPEKEIIKHNGSLLPKLYNQFFNPNICHICKSVDIDSSKSCDKCYMISYCHQDHKSFHEMQHKEICEAVVKLSKLKPRMISGPITLYRWINEKRKFMKLIHQSLFRQLEQHEEEMFLCMKSCLICYKQNYLNACKKCYSVNYCIQHKVQFNTEHTEFMCKQLRLLLNINIASMTPNLTEITRSFIAFADENIKFGNTFQLITEFAKIRKTLDWAATDYILSDYISGPLALYYGMQKSNFLQLLLQADIFTVHIITANRVNKNNLRAWEILLHCIPRIKKLVIIIIGSKLKPDPPIYEVCENCQSKKKQFSLSSVSKMYYEYTTDYKYKRPDVIVGIQVEITKKLWSQSIRAIQAQSCPLLLTTSDVFRTCRYIKEMKNILGANLTPDIEIKSPFNSCAPHKDFRIDGVYYCNKYILVYKNLNGSSSSI